MTTPAQPTRGGPDRDSTDDGAPAAVPFAQLEGIVVPTSLGEVVFERMRDAIIDKSLPPGSRIAEWAIAEQLGVSRTPVRETLWRLRQMGLIETVGRKGYQVAHPSRTAIEQAYEVHEALQVLATGVAASVRATTSWARSATPPRPRSTAPRTATWTGSCAGTTSSTSASRTPRATRASSS